MRFIKVNTGILLITLFSFSLVLSGCRKPVELKSRWMDREVIIDGNDSEWKDYPLYYDEETRSSIGFYNDSQNLYVFFKTMDEDLQWQILGRGIVMWFNKAGNKDKEWAIMFPMGRGPGGMHGGPPGRSQNKGKGNGPPGGSPDMKGPPPDRIAESRDRPPMGQFGAKSFLTPELKILNSEKDSGRPYTQNEVNLIGIYLKYTNNPGEGFVCELRIPLVKGDKTPHAVQVSGKNTAGIGFMTEKSKSRSGPGGMKRSGGMDGSGPGGGMGGPMGGGGPGGGMGGGPGGGMGGGPGGGMGGGPGGGMGGMSDQDTDLEIWTKITLASS